MARFVCTVPLALLALASAPTAAKDTQVSLEPTPRKGLRLEVKESSEWSITSTESQAGQKATSKTLRRMRREFVETVLKPLPRSSRWDVLESHRAEGPNAGALVERATSMHKRKVRVVGLARALENPALGELSKEDKESLRFDRLAAAFIDRRKAELRDSWKLPAKPFSEALYGEFIPASLTSGEAKLTLKSIERSEGRPVAVLRVSLLLRTKPYQTLPQIELKLRGTLRWDAEARALLETKLEGKLSFEASAGGKKTVVQGPYRYLRKVTVKAVGEEPGKALKAPPPADAKQLVCKLNPDHTIQLGEIKHCPPCGKPLNARRECPEKHEWLLRHCPQDGGVLEAK